ncbi:MAG: DUF2225 domain-containing protein [Oscillospiraceae bacterium]|nr:DUF2225 domain-containing protein [Oscillospiraceae bacterium]
MFDLSLLLDIGAITDFAPNQMLFMQNQAGNSMYIVLKGEFGVYIDSFSDFPIRVAGIKEGSFFGEMSVIDSLPRSATIISEGESVALVVEKENFVLLLEKAPDLAAKIMSSLVERVESTAGAVREAGKEAPTLPANYQNIKYRDAKSSMLFMSLLAKRLREMNELLCGSDKRGVISRETVSELESSDADDSSSETDSTRLIKLLPEGYVNFNMTDQNNNRFKLEIRKTICPLCFSKIDAVFPVFSALSLDTMELDGRVIYKHFDILLYTNIICPYCNYTDSYQEFGKPQVSGDDDGVYRNRFKNEEGFTGYASVSSHTLDEAVKSYYLNLACLSKVTKEPVRFAKSWIRLYWIYKDHERTELARQAAENAEKYYRQYLEESGGSIFGKDKMQLYTILGELSFALSDRGKATEYYREAIDAGKAHGTDFLKVCQKRYNELRKLK